MDKQQASAVSRTLGGVVGSCLLAAGIAVSADLPSAKSIASEMGYGWNLGNTLETPGGAPYWAPLPTQSVIDVVKAAGFKTVRLPAAWDSHADQTTLTIDPAWLAQVKDIVDMCIKDSLFVILNSHWDRGWLEEKIDPASQASVNVKQKAYWEQIATYFKDYGRHLLFAGANEPAVQDPYGTAFGPERVAALNSYHQTFIDAVRSTGGNNASRTLVIQGPHADIELTNKAYVDLPTDKIAGRLMFEIHFYPYQFTLMQKDESWGNQFYYWGNGNHSTTDAAHNPTWGEEAFVDSVFGLMKTQFVDKGLPVVVGEFGAGLRTTLPDDAYALHVRSRRAFYEYVAKSGKAKGMIPVAWDTDWKGDFNFTIVDRTGSGKIWDFGLANALRRGWGLPLLDTTAGTVEPGGNMAFRAYVSAKDSLYSQVELGVVKSDWTVYDSIKVRAFFKGTTAYDSAGKRYGYASPSLVTMSDEWTWREAPLGQPEFDAWNIYSVAIGNDTTGGKLAPAARSKVDFFALQTYSHGYRGAIYVDWIAFRKTSGTWDTLYTFDRAVPGKTGGNVDGLSLIAVGDVESDKSWTTKTTTRYGSTSVAGRILNGSSLKASIAGGTLRADWTASEASSGRAVVSDLQGRILWSGDFTAKAGENRLEAQVPTTTVSVLRIHCGTRELSATIVPR